jgi:hypothetical protein
MQILRCAPAFLVLFVSSACSFAACGGGLEEEEGVVAFGEPSLRGRRHPGSKADPPPAQCHRRHAGATAIEAVVRIERYRGLSRGRNGTHEIAFGTITSTPWVFDAGAIDTAHVQLSLSVASSTDSTGLPEEVPLVPGESILVEGEYIPASRANVRGARGATAVVHYTHAPCGFVVIKGRKYR